MPFSVEDLNTIQNAVKQQMDILTRRFNQQLSILRTDLDELKAEKRNISEAFTQLHTESINEMNQLMERNNVLMPTKNKYDSNITAIGKVNQYLNQNHEVDNFVRESMQRDNDAMQIYCNEIDIIAVNREIEENLLRIEKLNTRISLIVNLFS